MDIFEERKASGISRSHRLSILLQCGFLFLGVLVGIHLDNTLHTQKYIFSVLNLSVPSRPQASVQKKKKIHKVTAVVISNKVRAGLTFNSVALLCQRPASHPGVANAQSGIQT